MTTTDRTLVCWKSWLAYSISKESGSVLADLPLRLRDSSENKTYPAIHIGEGNVDRVEAGGVSDGNVWNIEIETMLVTTPGEDEEQASSREAHDILRNGLSAHVNSCIAQEWMNGQIGLTCFDLQDSSPLTEEKEGYRVTTWRNEATVCLK